MSIEERLGLLRERNLALFLGAAAGSTLGNGIANVALAFAVLQIGSAADLGLVLLAREVPIVAFLLLGGIWADRVSRKHLLVTGDIARGAAQASAGILIATGQASVLSLAVLQIVFGAAEAFTRPAITGLVPQAVRPEHLQQANALLNLARSTLRIAGPATGAAIVLAAGPASALVANAATFGVSAVLIAGMRIAPAAERVRSVGILADLRDGWHEFTARTWVWSMVAGFGVFQLSLFPALLVLGPYIAKTELGGAGAWGAILASQAAGAVVGSLAALRIRPRRPLFVSALLTMPSALLLALLGAGSPILILCTAAFAAGATLSATDILWFTALQQRIPERAISRISSFDWFGSVALNPIGYAIVGPLSEWIGVSATLVAAATVNASVSLAMALVPSIRAVRHTPGSMRTPQIFTCSSTRPTRERLPGEP